MTLAFAQQEAATKSFNERDAYSAAAVTAAAAAAAVVAAATAYVTAAPAATAPPQLHLGLRLLEATTSMPLGASPVRWRPRKQKRGSSA